MPLLTQKEELSFEVLTGYLSKGVAEVKCRRFYRMSKKQRDASSSVPAEQGKGAGPTTNPNPSSISANKGAGAGPTRVPTDQGHGAEPITVSSVPITRGAGEGATTNPIIEILD